MRSAICWFCRELVLAGAGDVEDFAAQGQDGLVDAVARLLGGAACAIAFDDEELGACGCVWRAIGELAGKPELADRGLAADFLFLAAAHALIGALDDPVEQLLGLGRVAGQPMIEMIAHGRFDDAERLDRRQPVLGLALEFRLADEDGEQRRRRVITSSPVMIAGALVVGELGVVLSERKSAVRKPCSWVPPSVVGMVLQ